MTGVPWTAAADGLQVDVRLTPRSGKDAVEGIERRPDGRPVLKVRVRAAPFEGAANTALLHLLADALDTAPGRVTLIAGATARVKRVAVAGDPEQLIARLERIVQVSA